MNVVKLMSDNPVAEYGAIAHDASVVLTQHKAPLHMMPVSFSPNTRI